MRTFFLTIFLTLALFVVSGASSALAQQLPAGGGGLVPCTNDCRFEDLMLLVQKLLNFLLYLAVFVATIMFAWAGFLLMTSGGDPGAKTRGKRMFWDALWGLIFMASAWLVVKVVLETLGADPFASKYLQMF